MYFVKIADGATSPDTALAIEKNRVLIFICIFKTLSNAISNSLGGQIHRIQPGPDPVYGRLFVLVLRLAVKMVESALIGGIWGGQGAGLSGAAEAFYGISFLWNYSGNGAAVHSALWLERLWRVGPHAGGGLVLDTDPVAGAGRRCLDWGPQA